MDKIFIIEKRLYARQRPQYIEIWPESKENEARKSIDNLILKNPGYYFSLQLREMGKRLDN